MGSSEIESMRPFAVVLEGIDRGRVSDEATRALAEVVAAVQQHEKAGSVTVKIEVKPRKGDSGTVEVKAAASSKVPGPDHTGVFFVDKDGLTRDDPSMTAMFSRTEVNGGNN